MKSTLSRNTIHGTGKMPSSTPTGIPPRPWEAMFMSMNIIERNFS
jgi:hypothetical protein